jgi:hypothetical protein
MDERTGKQRKNTINNLDMAGALLAAAMALAPVPAVHDIVIFLSWPWSKMVFSTSRSWATTTSHSSS